MNMDLKEKTEQWMQLERKTMEQRKAAEAFYDNNLMKLIEQDYCSRNEDFVFEQVEYLILSVGTSYEPLVLNIQLLKPLKILFLCTEQSEFILDKIVTYCGLSPSRFEKRRVDESNPLTIYKEIKKSYLSWGKPEKLYIDFTGGTKAMSAAAALAGALVNIQLVYVGCEHYLADFRKPEPGTEILLYIDNPIAVFGDLEIEKAFVLFDEYNYAGAREKLQILKESVPEPEIRQQLEFGCLLAEAYEAWDCLDFLKASQKMHHLNLCMKRDAATHKEFLLMDYKALLESQGRILMNLSHIPEKIRDRHQPEILRDRQLITGLMFSLYQNARVREHQEKYDMAALLMYRLLEMIEQRRLIEYNLYASNMDYTRLDTKKLKGRSCGNIESVTENMNRIREGVFGRAGDRSLPSQVSLLEGYMLLLAMGDEICHEDGGRDIDFIKRLRSMVYLRNNSIFAHGLGPVGEANYTKFREFVVMVLKKFCALENIDFDKMALNVSYINPRQSKFYTQTGE